MTQTEALKLALEAADELEWFLESGYEHGREGPPRVHRLIAKIRALSAQPEQKPVVVMELYTVGWDLVENIDIDWLESLPFGTKLYAHPHVQKLGMTKEKFKNDNTNSNY